MKSVRYLPYARYRHTGQVVYELFEDRCVFTGVTSDAVSTINAAEDIIKAICQQEKIAPVDLEFYDLQTHRTYPRHPPGEFAFDHLVIHRGGRLNIVRWEMVECPPEVLQKFDRFIGGGTKQQVY